MLWNSPSRASDAAALAELYAASEAATVGFDSAAFADLIAAVEAKYLPPRAGARQRATFRKNLHVNELVLARACARGDESAWQKFWLRYRDKLHAAARSITREASLATELADGLFGDLFGLRTREGERISKLNSYMGLGSLEGWLYTLLAQAHVDHWRRERRQVSLDESDHLQTLLVPPNQDEGGGGALGGSGAMQSRLEAAVEAVLGAVSGQPRLLLSLYFLDGQTLAQIGKLLHVHESTISRRLDKLLAQLRRNTLRELRQGGLQRPVAAAALHTDPRLLRVDVRKFLHALSPQDPL